MASNANSLESDPLSFKANADAFEKSDQEVIRFFLNIKFFFKKFLKEDDDDILRKDDEDEDQDGRKDGIYRPPKLAPVYNGRLFFKIKLNQN